MAGLLVKPGNWFGMVSQSVSGLQAGSLWNLEFRDFTCLDGAWVGVQVDGGVWVFGMYALCRRVLCTRYRGLWIDK